MMKVNLIIIHARIPSTTLRVRTSPMISALPGEAVSGRFKTLPSPCLSAGYVLIGPDKLLGNQIQGAVIGCMN